MTDTTTLLALFGLGLVGIAIGFAVTRLRDWQRRFELFAHQSELRVSDEVITAAVIRRLRRTENGSASGALVGLLLSALLFAIVHPADFQGFVWGAVLPLMLLGVTAGSMAASVSDELFSPDEHAPRVARAVSVTIRDYISPVRFWLVPALILTASLLAVMGLVLSSIGVIDPPRYFESSAVWVAALAVVLAIGGAIAARIVIRHKQAASDQLELAWSDALRADTLRNLWVFESEVGWLAVVFAGLGILRALDTPIEPQWARIVLQLSANLGIIALSRVFNYGGGRNYFRYRLWPILGDVGEIVDDSEEDDSEESDDARAAERRP
ncbi:hypothetical protein [Lacisediminihabitans changchengi]|uniref:Uncharacterized protein n=1 Tax=Lacisediminihabitans changchengi TaxID=2787634 RepID=A0A934W1U1_9MICO|nr:hypothetical protein [Lacisediminihabitans changchengi]MBK4346141.1 hypothetical protein [Lacisediminihabitans changchengi]